MHVKREFVFLFQDREALRVRLHHAVFDAVVHHLDEVPGAGRPDVSPALIFRGRQRFEKGPQTLDRSLIAADHHRVAFLQSPDPAAGADVHELKSLPFQSRGAALRIFVIAVSAVDQDVVF